MTLQQVERQLRANAAFSECYAAGDPRHAQLKTERITLEHRQKALIFGDNTHAPHHSQP